MNKLPLIVLLIASVASAQPGGTQPVPQGPATGPGLGVPAPAPTPVVAPAQLSDKELAELKEIEGDYDQFLDAAKQHDARMRLIARHEYNNRTAELEKRYADRIAKAEGDKDKLFANTLARLEKFLQDHPNHEQFTPDAMFRLADIYLTQADDEVDKKLAALDAAPADPSNPDAAAITASEGSEAAAGLHDDGRKWHGGYGRHGHGDPA